MSLAFFVPGVPAPQGSKRYLRPGVMVESNKRTAPWRADVRAAAAEAVLKADGYAEELWDGPLYLGITLYFPRPKSHYGTGRNAGQLKESAPLFHCQTPDLDKCARAIGDAITGVVFADDKAICRLDVEKEWSEDDRPGASVRVELMP